MANDTPHGLKSNRIRFIVITNYEKMPREKRTYYEKPMPFVVGSIESLSAPMHPPFLDPKFFGL
jgi:hypothetical protein